MLYEVVAYVRFTPNRNPDQLPSRMIAFAEYIMKETLIYKYKKESGCGGK